MGYELIGFIKKTGAKIRNIGEMTNKMEGKSQYNTDIYGIIARYLLIRA